MAAKGIRLQRDTNKIDKENEGASKHQSSGYQIAIGGEILAPLDVSASLARQAITSSGIVVGPGIARNSRPARTDMYFLLAFNFTRSLDGDSTHHH
jgi:hypothetical protein